MGDARDMIALALEKNPEVKFSLITNGLAFDDGWQRLMVDHGDYVNFSLNAADKRDARKNRTGIPLEKTWPTCAAFGTVDAAETSSPWSPVLSSCRRISGRCPN